MKKSLTSNLIDEFFAFLSNERGLSVKTSETYRNGLNQLIRWNKNNSAIEKLTTSELQDFIIDMNRTHSRRSVHNYVSAIKTFFKFLLENHHISVDQTSDLVLPKLEKLLPKVLNRQQIELLLGMPDVLIANHLVSEKIGIRDKMILELFYGSGLRISELRNLKNADIDRDQCILKILGKGGKERLSPFSSTAQRALSRFWGVFGNSQIFLLETENKSHLTVRQIQNRVKFYLQQAELPTDLSPHTIRHAYATHMLNAGADLRLIQELLGHANLSTTQVYTHIDSSAMKNIHSMCHPHG